MEDAVLVFTGSPREGAMACRVLESAGIAAAVAADREELRARLAEGIGALLLVEEVLAHGVLDALVRHVGAQPAWSDLPILLMTQRSAEPELQRAFERLGNVTFLERPVRTMTLVSAVRSALRGRRRQYEVRALNERKDQMLATLAHELRNPLAPIRNVAEVLRRRYPAPETGKMLSIVDRQLSHLTRLVDDLLDVARINSGKLELRRAETSTADVVQHAVEIASDAIGVRAHRLVVEQPDEPAVLLGDHVRLVQSVANLLVNAAKFTEPGGEIRLRVRAEGRMAEFAVRDSGRGIAPDELEAIFAMFRQSRQPGEPSTGLGLGLHLARAFAELHGGSVRAHSAGLGQGSEFTLALPIVVHARQVPQPAAPRAVQPPPQKVLVVDDNVDAANTLEAVLSLAGLQVTVVHDGASAVRHVCREAVDAVVMDIGMPVMNGYDAAREMRQCLHAGTPLLIALTGWGQYADKALAAQAGFDFHFVKPLAIEELLACLSVPRTATAS
ncbi:hybrid sensor histidine kinase/response regulator [Ramlibacter sp. AN1133]|uniref:hybrid sensor histidine kinase/response regulator n=1 Tax=Ramlibacter sp. AN1133 TaxID=3133429 RepID=UPI0030BEE34E